jgi:hypothetical protein
MLKDIPNHKYSIVSGELVRETSPCSKSVLFFLSLCLVLFRILLALFCLWTASCRISQHVLFVFPSRSVVSLVWVD